MPDASTPSQRIRFHTSKPQASVSQLMKTGMLRCSSHTVTQSINDDRLRVDYIIEWSLYVFIKGGYL